MDQDSKQDIRFKVRINQDNLKQKLLSNLPILNNSKAVVPINNS